MSDGSVGGSDERQPWSIEPADGLAAGGEGGIGELADWWRRALAIVIDSFAVGIPLTFVLIAMGVIDIDTSAPSGEVVVDPGGTTATLIQLAVAVGYSAVLEGSARGQSLGKMAMGIKVVDVRTGGPIGPGRAALRRFVYSILFTAWVIPGVLNALSPLWDRKRQAWHDKPVGSAVVMASPVGSGHG